MLPNSPVGSISLSQCCVQRQNNLGTKHQQCTTANEAPLVTGLRTSQRRPAANPPMFVDFAYRHEFIKHTQNTIYKPCYSLGETHFPDVHIKKACNRSNRPQSGCDSS